jgi:hypothetical protein
MQPTPCARGPALIFDKPKSRNTDETITLLARMARFVIADISDAKSVLQEFRAIVPDVHVPVQPIIIAMQEEPGMFDFYRNYQWFGVQGAGRSLSRSRGLLPKGSQRPTSGGRRSGGAVEDLSDAGKNGQNRRRGAIRGARLQFARWPGEQVRKADRGSRRLDGLESREFAIARVNNY